MKDRVIYNVILKFRFSKVKYYLNNNSGELEYVIWKKLHSSMFNNKLFCLNQIYKVFKSFCNWTESEEDFINWNNFIFYFEIIHIISEQMFMWYKKMQIINKNINNKWSKCEPCGITNSILNGSIIKSLLFLLPLCLWHKKSTKIKKEPWIPIAWCLLERNVWWILSKAL